MTEIIKESILHEASPFFPYNCFSSSANDEYHKTHTFNSMHWHEDFQFKLCTKGSVITNTLEGDYKIKAGEAVFVNSRVVHRDILTEGSRSLCYSVSPKMVSFYADSPAAKLVEALADNAALPIYIFQTNISWHQNICAYLQELAKLENDKSPICCYEVMYLLTGIFLNIFKNIQMPENKPESIQETRMRSIVSFIEQNYSKNISLDALCLHAHMSKSALLRLFHKSLHTTPYAYISDYRIDKAKTLLHTTCKPLIQISLDVGFNSQSHFGKIFLEKTGMTPAQFRKIKP